MSAMQIIQEVWHPWNPVGSTHIFQKSEETRGLRYVQYLRDADSASLRKVCESKAYDCVDIKKLECVGHVQKQCGTRLRYLTQDNKGTKLSDGKGLAGAGRLTDKTTKKLSQLFCLMWPPQNPKHANPKQKSHA